MPLPQTPEHSEADHPAIPATKTGILLANLGTPDNYDYWSMRRYLSEFLSDRRVIDLPRWKWQPLLQLIILTKRPFSSGAAYKSIWNEDKGESPLMTITRDQTEAIATRMNDTYGDRVMVDSVCGIAIHPRNPKSARWWMRDAVRYCFSRSIHSTAGATSATAIDEFYRTLSQETWQPTARVLAPTLMTLSTSTPWPHRLKPLMKRQRRSPRS